MKAEEERANDGQYTASDAQFSTGHTTAQGSIAIMTMINATQQHQIAAVQKQMSQSANYVGQVIYCPPVQQSMIQMQMSMHQQELQQEHGRYGGRHDRQNSGW